METIEIGRQSGARVVASHIKAKGAHFWGSSGSAIQLIQRARDEGVRVWADQYPYATSGSDGNTVLLPRWALSSPDGRDGPHGSLAGAPRYDANAFADDKSLERTVGNYWPYATSLFDYIRRAMPFDRPGSLDSDEVYAVTAYILFLNGLIEESTAIDRETLPQIEMPARKYFRAAGRLGAER